MTPKRLKIVTHYIHNLDPTFLSLGPVTIRWYGLMYLVGFTSGYFLVKRKFRLGLCALQPEQQQDLITYLLAGMLIGARSVYVLIYNPEILQDSFWNLFAVWQGGLSYHGAAIGFAVAMWLYGRKIKVEFFHICDYVCLAAGLGVFFGRIGNFINGELWGRTTDVPWGVIFSNTGGGPLPRHPSQLYQAIGEGLLLMILLLLIEKREVRKGFAPNPKDQKKKTHLWKRTGIMGSSYLIFYGASRFMTEFFRQPDPQLGFYFGWMSMGQILCLMMILIGTIVLFSRIKKPRKMEYPAR